MLSQTCKAAIKAVIYLASHDESARKGILQIASDTGENEHTLGKLLQKLVKAGIIHSAKGPNGGFYIDSAQKQQPIEKIVHCIDGDEIFKRCGLGLSECSNSKPCPLHTAYEPIRKQFRQLCAEHTIQELCGPLGQGLTYLVL